MERRKFLKAAAGGSAALALASCNNSDSKEKSSAVKSTKKFKWRCQMLVSKTLPIWSDGIIQLAKRIKTLSDGRLDIKVYGGGEIVGAMEVFDAVKQGNLEMGHAASYFWGGKAPGAEFFTSIPFGVNANGMYTWITQGGGLKLWEELYKPHKLVPIPCGATGVQMGGWFNKEINSIADLKGLKMRMPGLGGSVITKAGASAERTPPGEIYTALSTGRLDATEWVGPYHDMIMKFHKVTKFYYIGGWHEPGSILELLINEDAWNSLPEDLQLIVRICAADTHQWIFSKWLYEDAKAYQDVKKLKNITVKEFPMDVIKELKKISKDVIGELARKNDMTKKIFKSYTEFEKVYDEYLDISERAYTKGLKA
ncbi:MAG: ABC transporter substrate-binding protein [Planctomycetota bacterium]|nr:MAG: ABC transporter substrate-binding protein [Planctomycetota bacterium]